MEILKLNHISSGYGKKQILYDINLEIEQDSITLLVGSNGSGKSTLFKTIYGLLPKMQVDRTEFSIFFRNQEITDIPTHKLLSKGIMYVPQKDELFDELSVKENIQFSLLHNRRASESKLVIDQVFENFQEIFTKSNRKVRDLSGGERKLLSLSMVFANQPELVLYDEPLAGLSGGNEQVVLQWIEKLNKQGTTFVIIEHRIAELTNLANQIIGLKLGSLYKNRFDNIEDIKSFMI